MAQFKGTVFSSARAFTLQRFGEPALSQVLAELPAADLEVLSSVTPVGWYPVEPVLRFHHALDRICGSGDLSLCTEAGRFSADWMLNTVLKLFLRFKDPHWLGDKQASVWRQHHDSGRWEYDDKSPQRMVGRLHEFAVKDAAFCARLRGWLEGAIGLTGGKQPRVLEPHCRLRGAPFCEFDCRWS